MRLKPLLILLSLLLAIPASAQRPDRRRGPDSGKAERGAPEASASKSDRKDGVQDYDKVILEGFKSDSGLFVVHRGDDKVFYEIPQEAFGKDMLWVTQIAKTQAGFGYGGTGVGNRVVRWELNDEKVLLRDIKFRIRNQDNDTVRNAVEATSLAPIIKVFPVKAWGKDKRAVIDVTSLFMDDLQEFSAKRQVNGSGADKSRTFIEEVKSFPQNIEAKVLMTYRLSSSSSSERGGSPRRRGGVRRDPSQSAVTVLLHHSMVKLPDNPMTPRVKDDRVGFFGISFENYDGSDHEVETIRYISRWRLEKKDASAEVSDPIKPIVFYVGRGVPEKWRPWVHKGIEMWQPAFEAAGFSNAILAKDAPSPREDADWDAEDARYSSIRWLPSTTENAMGPHVSDPRTGEILDSDIVVYHNVLKLIRDWYFIQASPNDPAAQKLPLADDTMGQALAYVIAHEVGHTLGFPHNMKASSTYSVAQLRDAKFTAEFGTEASIMDYGRFNYVAQPGDGARLIPLVGPYDFFAADWGYRQFANAEAEKLAQAALLAKQVDNPMLRFGDPNSGVDPSQQTEDLGANPIEATAMGLLNLDRVASYLVDACCSEGEDYKLLQNMYDQLIGQRNRELMHVANLVGGVNKANLHFGDADQVYYSVGSEQQAEAIAFLNEHAFRTPQSMINPEILQRLEAGGAPDRILSSQKRLLRTLISSSRVKRMSEQASRGDSAMHYTPLKMLSDLREGIWSELKTDPASVDLYRRNLQRAHVEVLADQLGDDFPDTDLPALARGELSILLGSLQNLKRNWPGESAAAETILHYTDLEARIQAVLDPRSQNRSEINASLSPRAGH
jgi:uncharacterized protein DUF4953/uncharacterized protein DUF5117/uncharacterized protein DUF5118